MTLWLALDCSRWGGPLTDEEAECMKSWVLEVGGVGLDARIKAIMPGSGPGGYGEYTEQQSLMALKHGYDLYGYSFYEWGFAPDYWMREAAKSFGAALPHVQKFATDIEDTSKPAPINFEAVIQDCFRQAAIYFPPECDTKILYTGGWYVRGHLGNVNLKALLPGVRLHNSYYDGDPDVDGLPYGGFTAEDVILEQFQGTTDVCGQSVDLNAIMEQDMTVDELHKELTALGLIGPGVPTLDRLDEWATEKAAQDELRFQHLEAATGTRGLYPHSHKPEDIPHSHDSTGPRKWG